MSDAMLKTIDYLFTEQDSLEAYEEWGANCGPNALAFALRVPLESVRYAIPDFDAKRYTSPTMMAAGIAAMGRTYKPYEFPRVVAAMFSPAPILSLVRIQWTGPWTVEGSNPKWAYRQTHWVGSVEGTRRTDGLRCERRGDGLRGLEKRSRAGSHRSDEAGRRRMVPNSRLAGDAVTDTPLTPADIEALTEWANRWAPDGHVNFKLVLRLIAEWKKQRTELSEWLWAARLQHNATTDEEDRAAALALDSLRTGNAYCEISEPTVKVLIDQRDKIIKTLAERVGMCSELLGRCAGRNPELAADVERFLAVLNAK